MEELLKNLKVQIVEQLNLKDINPENIGNDESLFGDGIGLDSIDALELIVLLQQEYGLKLSKAEDDPKVFKSVQTMADFIIANKK